MKSIYVAIFCAIILTIGSASANAAKRVALIIGNSAYLNVAELPNPKNDAVAMSKKLSSLDFEVIEGIDLDHTAMRRTVRQFIDKLEGAELALFFYAGHGLQVNGNNYMAPIDARLRSHNDLEFETIPMNLVLSAMERNVKTNMIFLDACRDNPLAENLARSMGTRSAAVGRGLARIGSGVGTFVSFSTQPGNVALDGNGINSPYTTALLEHLGTPGEDITRSMIRVRRAVLKSTSGKQVPWEHSSLTGEVVLKAEQQLPKVAAINPDSDSTAQPDNTIELTYWNSIKDADNAFLKIYLDRYPNGLFSDIANLKISLAKKQALRALEQKANISKNPKTPPAPKTTSDEPTKLALLPLSLPASPTTETIVSVQRELNRIGCNAGSADGVWGKGSRAALKKYQRFGNLKLASLEPSTALLNQLKNRTNRICPLTCRTGFENKSNKCVRIKQQANLKKQQPLRQNKKKTIARKPLKPKKKTASARGSKKYRCVETGKGVTRILTEKVRWEESFNYSQCKEL